MAVSTTALAAAIRGNAYGRGASARHAVRRANPAADVCWRDVQLLRDQRGDRGRAVSDLSQLLGAAGGGGDSPARHGAVAARAALRRFMADPRPQLSARQESRALA